MNRVVQLKQTAFPELHQRHRGDRLGHRVDAEERVVGHGAPAFDVHVAERGETGKFAAPRDGELTAGDTLGLDVVVFEVIGNALQTLHIEPCPAPLRRCLSMPSVCR